MRFRVKREFQHAVPCSERHEVYTIFQCNSALDNESVVFTSLAKVGGHRQAESDRNFGIFSLRVRK